MAESDFNRTSGIGYRYGGDGYAANSKSRYTGPVGFPNQIENPTKSAAVVVVFHLDDANCGSYMGRLYKYNESYCN